MTRSVVLAILACHLAGSSWAQELPEGAQPPGPWTLQDCVQYALLHSPRLAAEEHRLRAAGESTREAEAADDLRVDLGAAAALRGPEVVVDLPNVGAITVLPARQGSVTLQAALPLDISKRYRHLREAARYSEVAQGAAYRQALQQLLLETVARYYGVLEARSGVVAAEAALREAQSGLEILRAQSAAGLATPTDLQAAESRLAAAEEALATARGAESDARAALASLLGLRPDEAPDIVPEQLALSADLPWEQARDVALQERPEISALVAHARSLGASAEAVHASTRPSLALGAVSELATKTAFSPGQSWRVGLSFTWPLSDGGATAAREAGLRETREAVLRDLEDLRLLTQIQVHTAMTRLAVLSERVAASRSALETAESLLAQTQARAAAGVARPHEVRKAEAGRDQAKAALERDLWEQSVALAEWARAVGLIDRLMIVEPVDSSVEEGSR